jgi:hypothetical protein
MSPVQMLTIPQQIAAVRMKFLEKVRFSVVDLDDVSQAYLGPKYFNEILIGSSNGI